LPCSVTPSELAHENPIDAAVALHHDRQRCRPRGVSVTAERVNESDGMSERISALSVLVMVGVGALTSVACGDPSRATPIANGGSGGSGGNAGNAGSSSPSGAGTGNVSGASTQLGTALVWDADGFVAPDTNPYAIQGPFYFYSDCDPPSGLACTMTDSSLTGADGKAGWSVDASKVCAKGTAVQVESAMFAAQWGAGIALDLNSKGGEPGTPAVKGTFDLAAAKITGFSLDISGAAPGRIRINLTMPGVADSSFVEAKVPGTTTFNVADLKQGSWVTEKVPLDPTKVEALQLQVFTNAATPTPYDFCVNAIRVISESASQ
jgi:hypothetical protein